MLLVTHGRFTYRRINGHTHTHIQLTFYSRILRIYLNQGQSVILVKQHCVLSDNNGNEYIDCR